MEQLKQNYSKHLLLQEKIFLNKLLVEKTELADLLHDEINQIVEKINDIADTLYLIDDTTELPKDQTQGIVEVAAQAKQQFIEEEEAEESRKKTLEEQLSEKKPKKKFTCEECKWSTVQKKRFDDHSCDEGTEIAKTSVDKIYALLQDGKPRQLFELRAELGFQPSKAVQSLVIANKIEQVGGKWQLKSPGKFDAPNPEVMSKEQKVFDSLIENTNGKSKPNGIPDDIEIIRLLELNPSGVLISRIADQFKLDTPDLKNTMSRLISEKRVRYMNGYYYKLVGF